MVFRAYYCHWRCSDWGSAEGGSSAGASSATAVAAGMIGFGCRGPGAASAVGLAGQLVSASGACLGRP